MPVLFRDAAALAALGAFVAMIAMWSDVVRILA